MKLACVIFRYFPFGGLQRDLVRIVQEAAGRRHEVTVLMAKQDEPFPEMKNVSVRMIPYHGWTNHGRMKSFASGIRNVLRKESFDRVLMFNRIDGGDFYFAADNCLKTEWSRRHSGVVLHLLPRYRIFLELERRIFSPEAKTKIFTIVPGQQKDYQKAYGTQPERFRELPPGIDKECRRKENHEEIRQRIRYSFGIGEKELLLIQTASSFRTKGVDRTILAVGALPREWKEKCVLLIVGDDPSPVYRALVKEHQVRAIFPGARKDLPDVLAGADLMVHPARNEAAGAVIAEALVMGVPVIASGACGFAVYAAETDPSLVLKEPFRQEELNQVLLHALENCSSLRKRTEELISARDFYRRAAAAVDRMEQD